MTESEIRFDKDGTPMIHYNNSRCVESNGKIVVDLRGTPFGYEILFVYNLDTEEWDEQVM